MGWYQDNFPGSPAARQRAAISRGVVIYSLITGTVFYLFAPFSRRIRKDLAEGKELVEWRWFADRRDIKRFENRNIFVTQPTLEQLLEVKQLEDKRKRGDFAGPAVSDETIRRG